MECHIKGYDIFFLDDQYPNLSIQGVDLDGEFQHNINREGIKLPLINSVEFIFSSSSNLVLKNFDITSPYR